ncbi:hypothetical protein LDENG_00103430 [Lucifuga dentata]|nr:hypothetical protein LDENG_00103430 [Lucifuga dentata]
MQTFSPSHILSSFLSSLHRLIIPRPWSICLPCLRGSITPSAAQPLTCTELLQPAGGILHIKTASSTTNSSDRSQRSCSPAAAHTSDVWFFF